MVHTFWCQRQFAFVPPITKVVPPRTIVPPKTFVPLRTFVPPRIRMTSCYSNIWQKNTHCVMKQIFAFLNLWIKFEFTFTFFSTLENLEQQLRMQLDASVGRISKGIRRLLLSCPLLMLCEIGKALCFRMSFSRLWLADHVITRPPTAICFELQAQHCKQPD